jgi:hypothetical protein
LAQHAFVQPAAHFFSAFLAHASHDLPSLQEVHAGFSAQAKTDDPAMNNAIAAILIILFIVGAPILISHTTNIGPISFAY